MFFLIAYQFSDNMAFMILSALGLGLIFGMMGVVNLAHGDMIALGAYGTALSFKAGLPLVFAMIFGTLFTALVGWMFERLVVRRLYGRILDSVVATWGAGLILSQTLLIFFGPRLKSIGTPMGSFVVGDQSYSQYRMLVIVVAMMAVSTMIAALRYTRAGIYARAAVQDPDMARALGLNVSRVYSTTFAVGAGLAGFAGALYAPTMVLVPTMGSAFVVKAFVTVVVGGADIVLGLTGAAALLASIETGLTASYGPLIGQVGILFAVIVAIRLMPRGVTGLLKAIR